LLRGSDPWLTWIRCLSALFYRADPLNRAHNPRAR
jgi:hypothetical protein